MSNTESYIKDAVRLIDGIRHNHDPEELVEEYGIIETNPHDEDENGAASITLTLGGPTVYLTIDDTVNFHYGNGDETYDEVLSSDEETVKLVKQFVEETS